MPGLGGGIAITGGGGGGLASPAAGVPGAGIGNLLASALSNMPQLEEQKKERDLKLKAAQQDLDTQRLQNDTVRQKQAAAQLNALQQYMRNKPELAQDPTLVAQYKQLAQQAGLPAPTTMIGGGANAPTNAFDGAGDASGLPANQNQPAQGREAIDVQAITPGFDPAQLLASPAAIKEAMLLPEATRRAVYRGMPEGFYTAPKELSPQDVAQQRDALSLFQSMAKSGDKNSVSAALQFVTKTFPNIDTSMLLTPDVKNGIIAQNDKRLQILERAGVLKGQQIQIERKRTDAQVNHMGAQDRYLGAESALARERTALLPREFQEKLARDMQTANHQAATLKIARDRLKNDVQKGTIARIHASKASAIQVRGQLDAQIRLLQAQVGRIATGDSADTADPNDPNKTLVQSYSEQIIALQDQKNDIDKAIADAGSKPVQLDALNRTIGGTTKATAIGDAKNDPAARGRSKQHGAPDGYNASTKQYHYADGTVLDEKDVDR